MKVFREKSKAGLQHCSPLALYFALIILKREQAIYTIGKLHRLQSRQYREIVLKIIQMVKK